MQRFLSNAGEIPDHPLLNYPYEPGHRGVDTSIEAATKTGKRSKEVEKKVLHAMKIRGARGAIDEELPEITGFEPGTAQPARSRLSKRNLLKDSGTTRPNERGNKCIVWVIA